MKQLYFFIITAVTFLLFSPRAFAQRDVETLLYDNSIEKLLKLYGEPMERTEFEGENGECVTMLYPGFFATIYKDDSNIGHIYIWTSDLCVLSSVVPGGIKVGDSVEKYKDVDFSKEVTGKHYESCGFIPMNETYRSHSSANILVVFHLVCPI